MPRDRQIFCAAMLTPSVKVGNTSWSSAICSTVILAVMQAATVCTVSAEYSPSTCAEDGAGPAVRDQLAEALWPAVGYGRSKSS
jgi:hypothetical protein